MEPSRRSPYPTERARALRSNQTTPEAILWKHVRNRGLLGLKFRRQHPIGTYIVDFACCEIKLVIELDGRHHEFQVEADRARDHCLSGLGWHVVRVSVSEFMKRPDATINHIAATAQRLIEAGEKRRP